LKLRIDLDDADAVLEDEALLPFRALLAELVFPDISFTAVPDRWKACYINYFGIGWLRGRSKLLFP
jgi:hypothetical protein